MAHVRCACDAGMFRPPPGERSPVKSGPGARAATLDLGGRTEYTNLQMVGARLSTKPAPPHPLRPQPFHLCAASHVLCSLRLLISRVRSSRLPYLSLAQYPESVYLADNKDYTTAMRRVNARKWTKETAQEVEEESKRLQHEFDQARPSRPVSCLMPLHALPCPLMSPHVSSSHASSILRHPSDTSPHCFTPPLLLLPSTIRRCSAATSCHVSAISCSAHK